MTVLQLWLSPCLGAPDGLRSDAEEGPVEASRTAQGPGEEGEATHSVPQALPAKEEGEKQEEEGEGLVEPGVHQQVLRQQALSSLECSPVKGLVGRAGRLGDRLGLGPGLECSP